MDVTSLQTLPSEPDTIFNAWSSNEITQETIVLEIPADLHYVHMLGRCACALLEQIDTLVDAEATLYNLELAIQEVGVNIITHAYAGREGRVMMTGTYNEQTKQLIVTLEDRGQSFNPEAVVAPDLGTLQEHGFGLFLARELVDELQYEPYELGNRWCLKKTFVLQHCSNSSSNSTHEGE